MELDYRDYTEGRLMICLTCGAVVPATHTLVHSDWHREMTETRWLARRAADLTMPLG